VDARSRHPAVHKRYQLPGVYRVIGLASRLREFFYTTERGGAWGPTLCMPRRPRPPWAIPLPDMVEMSDAVNTQGKAYLPEDTLTSRWIPTAAQPLVGRRGHFAIEIKARQKEW